MKWVLCFFLHVWVSKEAKVGPKQTFDSTGTNSWRVHFSRWLDILKKAYTENPHNIYLQGLYSLLPLGCVQPTQCQLKASLQGKRCWILMLEDAVRSTSDTEQLLRHCAPSLPLPQLPAGASRALCGEKGGEEGYCVLFNGDRASGEQLSGCCHSDAPFRWPLRPQFIHPMCTIALLLLCRAEIPSPSTDPSTFPGSGNRQPTLCYQG